LGAALAKRAGPALWRLRQWIDQHKDRIAPKSLLGKAVYYLDQQWPRLVRYVEDGRYPIDNNPAENAIRPFVVGRKNWLFSATPRGADASANLYSLIKTAKANGLESQTYLTRLFTQLPNATTFGEIEALLPWPAKIENP
jgi:transposase